MKEEDVLDLIHDIMHKCRMQQYRVARSSEHDLTQMDSRVLSFFHRHPGETQSDLVQHSGRDKAQLARLIKNLRARGLLDAEVDPNDRRHVRLSLTPAGIALQTGLRQSARQLTARAVAGLTAVEKQQLHDLLKRVQSNMEGLEKN